MYEKHIAGPNMPLRMMSILLGEMMGSATGINDDRRLIRRKSPDIDSTKIVYIKEIILCSKTL